MERETKYKHLYKRLRKQILQGQFLEGSILPSENDLKETYQVTQPTVRHALNLLVEERLIKKHQGKGSIVVARPKGVEILSNDAKSVTSQNDGENIKTTVINGPLVVAWPLDLPFYIDEITAKSGVVMIERIRTVNEVPVFFEKLWIPAINMEGFCGLDLNNVSLYDLLGSEYQISVKSSQQKITAVASNKEIGGFLKVNKGWPLVRLDRKLETNREGFHIYSTLFANTANYTLYIKS